MEEKEDSEEESEEEESEEGSEEGGSEEGSEEEGSEEESEEELEEESEEDSDNGEPFSMHVPKTPPGTNKERTAIFLASLQETQKSLEGSTCPTQEEADTARKKQRKAERNKRKREEEDLSSQATNPAKQRVSTQSQPKHSNTAQPQARKIKKQKKVG